MTLIEQAIQAEQEYKNKMKEATDRLKHIQGYLGHIYISEEIIGVESVSVKDDMVHLDVRCSFEAYGLDDDSVFSCDIPLVIFNATDNENGFTEKKDEITFNGTKYVFKEKLPDQDGIRTYVYEEFHSEVPNDAPEVTLPELKVTRFVDENGNDIHELEENFVEKLDINGYVFKETTETSDIRTHVYTKVETEIPNDSPTVEVPELKITRFIDTNGVELKNIVEGFVEKDSNIIYENEQYDYVNTTEENGIRTHVYKKHVTEEVPNNNSTTPTDNNTTTENKVIVEHTAPTGDSMNNTLKLFALSVLGLGFVLLYRKKVAG